jgi:glycosyltransferase 2 family protein
MARSRYLIATTEQPRVRRAADATGVVVGLAILLASWRAFRQVIDLDQTMSDLLSSLPEWLTGTLPAIYGLGGLYAISVFVAVLIQWKQRKDAARDMVLSVIATALISTLLVRVISEAWPLVIPELGLAVPVAQFPIFRVVLVTAVILAVAPHLTRPMRRFGWFVILLVGFAGFGLGFGLPSSAIGAIGLGLAAASSVMLVFGSPRGYPDVASIQDGLIGLGVDVTNVHLDDDQSWGVRRLIGDSESHGRVEIKAYGRDATDSQLFARTWRYLWYRDTQPTLMLTRMQSVEHEALVTMMAERTSASTSHVLAAGLGGDDVALLAVDWSGSRLSEVDPIQVGDDDLVSIWTSVGVLHQASISHGGLDATAITIGDHGHQIGDFGSGTLAGPESLLTIDVVELLFSMSQLFGVERTVATAHTSLGDDALAEVLPYIQTPAVSTRAKRRIDKPKVLINEIHDEVARVTGVEVEEPIQIRRVQGKNLVMTGLTLFAISFLISAFSDIDFVAVWAEVQNAQWAWIVVAFLVGQLVYFPEATGMLAAVGYPIPLRPVLVLQSAVKFIGLAVPSTAGRVGMTAAFLRKYGISFTASLVQGSIDTISGLAVEVVILVTAFAFGGVSFGLTTGDTKWGVVLILIISFVAVAVFVVRRVQKLRDWIMPVLGEAFGALAGVLKDPKRTLGLLASNFAARFILAISLWMILLSLDVSLGIWSVLTATVATGLLGGLVPIPGGVGVSEAVLTAFLVLFGVDETTAFAAAVVYRTATFYIPAAAGFFSMRWLEDKGYI